MTRPSAAVVRTYVPALIGAGVSALFALILPLAPLFLVPLGVVALTGSAASAALCAALTVLLNLSAGIVVGGLGNPLRSGAFLNSLYLAVMVAGFSWASYRGKGPRTAYKLSFAAIMSSLVLVPIFLISRNDGVFRSFIQTQSQAIVEAFKASAGADVVEKSVLDRVLSADGIAEAMSLMVTRGAVFAHLILFVFSWRFAYMAASFRSPALRSAFVFSSFRNDARLVWVLILSLLGALATLKIENEIFSIVSWNALFLVAFLFLGQGCAIIAFSLSRPGVPRALKPLAFALGALILLRPGINAFVVVALAILGVAENWLPLRAPNKIEPPPTPGA